MNDWDFLHEMRDQGFTAKAIADAAAVGYAPWDAPYLSTEWIDAELADPLPNNASSLKQKQQFRSREGFPYSVLRQIEIFRTAVEGFSEHAFRNLTVTGWCTCMDSATEPHE